MHLVSGERLAVIRPEPEKITIKTIAYGLAGQFRFGGQSRPRITVAEHSILTAELAERRGHGLRMAILMLLHDAAEGLGWGDLPRPHKSQCTNYRTLIDRTQAAVWHALHIRPPYPCERKTMRVLDDTVLVTEVEWTDFDSLGWHLLERPDPDTEIQGWPPEVAEHMFLTAWKELRNRAAAEVSV